MIIYRVPISRCQCLGPAASRRVEEHDTDAEKQTAETYFQQYAVQFCVQHWLNAPGDLTRPPFVDVRVEKRARAELFDEAHPDGGVFLPRDTAKFPDFLYRGHYADAKSRFTIRRSEGKPDWINVFASYRGSVAGCIEIDIHGWNFVRDLHDKAQWQPHRDAKRAAKDPGGWAYIRGHGVDPTLLLPPGDLRGLRPRES